MERPSAEEIQKLLKNINNLSADQLTDFYEKLRRYHHPYCYQSNNNYAYFSDLKEIENSPLIQERLELESKDTNFVPTYDKWCLYCDNKGAKKRCTRCRSVYFCDRKCQQKAWPIHKKHCGRDLFQLCISCGQSVTKSSLKCKKCPVRFCCQKHYQHIIAMHLEADCKTMQRFNQI